MRMQFNFSWLRITAILSLVFVACAALSPKADAFDCKDISTLERGSQTGNPASQLTLAKLYLYRACGLSENDDLAFKLTKASADKAYPAAESLLAYLLHKGLGAVRNDDAAATWARRAAEQNDGAGQIILSGMYERGEGGLQRDYVEADKWYILAAKGDAANATLSLARTALELSMSAAQIAEAQRRAEGWTPVPRSNE